MSKTVVIENLSMTGILKWLTETYKEKKSGKPFELQDVQGYITRGTIPDHYGGGYDIISYSNKFTKLYKLVQ